MTQNRHLTVKRTSRFALPTGDRVGQRALAARTGFILIWTPQRAMAVPAPGGAGKAVRDFYRYVPDRRQGTGRVKQQVND